MSYDSKGHNLSLQIGIFNAVIKDTPNENGGNVIHQERLLILNTHYEGNTKKKTKRFHIFLPRIDSPRSVVPCNDRSSFPRLPRLYCHTCLAQDQVDPCQRQLYCRHDYHY